MQEEVFRERRRQASEAAEAKLRSLSAEEHRRALKEAREALDEREALLEKRDTDSARREAQSLSERARLEELQKNLTQRRAELEEALSDLSAQRERLSLERNDLSNARAALEEARRDSMRVELLAEELKSAQERREVRLPLFLLLLHALRFTSAFLGGRCLLVVSAHRLCSLPAAPSDARAASPLSRGK